MTCMYCREEDKLFVCIRTTPSCIHTKKLKLCFCVWTHMTWRRVSESTFPLKYHSTTLERQLKYLKSFATMCLWQSNDLSTMLCHQSFLVQCLFSTYWEVLPFVESIWYFTIIKYLISLFSSKAASRVPLIRDHDNVSNRHVTQSHLIYVVTLILAPTMLDAPSWQ